MPGLSSEDRHTSNPLPAPYRRLPLSYLGRLATSGPRPKKTLPPLDNSRAGNRVPYALIHQNAALWPFDLRGAHVLGQEHPAVPDLSSVTDAGPRPDSMSAV